MAILTEAKRSAIEGHGGRPGLHATIADDEVDGECVPGLLPAVVPLVGEPDGLARRGRGVGIPHLK